MKKLLIFVTLIFISATNLFSQEIAGKWMGTLEVAGGKLRIVFNISQTDNGYSSTMDSPDQGVNGIPIDATLFENGELTMEIRSLQVACKGHLDGDQIKGTFNQSGMSIPINLGRANKEDVKLNRPQEPTPPYPYLCEEVSFRNEKDGVTLSGTLTLPKTGDNFTCVVLVTGSGPQDRNEEILGHKSFLVIADYLTKQGVAVLRYDDRGVGQSTGSFASATMADLADDAQYAVEYLKERKQINKQKIGICGHSEGGIIAPMVASVSDDVNFIVLMAGMGIKGDELMLMQKKLIEQQMGFNDTLVAQSQEVFAGAYKIITDLSVEPTQLNDRVLSYFKDKSQGASPEEQLTALTRAVTSSHIVGILRCDPQLYLTKVRCPVLAINGSKDLQVPCKENFDGIKSALDKGGNKKYTFVELENLNHLFQECSTGLPTEYGAIEQTFSPKALELIGDWVLKQ